MIQQGKTFTTKDGDDYTILKYNNSNDVKIEFESGEIQRVKLSEIYTDNVHPTDTNEVDNSDYDFSKPEPD